MRHTYLRAVSRCQRRPPNTECVIQVSCFAATIVCVSRVESVRCAFAVRTSLQKDGLTSTSIAPVSTNNAHSTQKTHTLVVTIRPSETTASAVSPLLGFALLRVSSSVRVSYVQCSRVPGANSRRPATDLTENLVYTLKTCFQFRNIILLLNIYNISIGFQHKCCNLQSSIIGIE